MLGDRKHKTRWIKIISNPKPWEILYVPCPFRSLQVVPILLLFFHVDVSDSSFFCTSSVTEPVRSYHVTPRIRLQHLPSNLLNLFSVALFVFHSFVADRIQRIKRTGSQNASLFHTGCYSTLLHAVQCIEILRLYMSSIVFMSLLIFYILSIFSRVTMLSQNSLQPFCRITNQSTRLIKVLIYR